MKREKLHERVICWFSCGIPSAMAAMLALKKYKNKEVIVARIVIKNEHPDNDRFCNEVEERLGVPVVRLASEEYEDCWDVWDKKKFLVSAFGAPCTVELKKMVRHAFERVGDIQVFGYTADPTDKKNEIMYLDELKKGFGHYPTELKPSCGFFCNDEEFK